jgi:hypothetical protein
VSPAPDGHLTAENGDRLTIDEHAAIQAMHRLAKRWPQTIKLVSMGGSLHIIHTADERFHDPDNQVRAESVLTSIDGIPNDGGDW